MERKSHKATVRLRIDQTKEAVIASGVIVHYSSLHRIFNVKSHSTAENVSKKMNSSLYAWLLSDDNGDVTQTAEKRYTTYQHKFLLVLRSISRQPKCSNSEFHKRFNGF